MGYCKGLTASLNHKYKTRLKAANTLAVLSRSGNDEVKKRFNEIDT
jgi:hypothetical protein